MKKVKFLYDKVMEITGQVGKDHVGAYAAQAAYFFMLSLIPIILLLITLVQYTPVTKADVMTAVLQVFPKSVDSLITSIVNQVYNQSGGIISLTIIVALWSAGKGVLALTTALCSAPRRAIPTSTPRSSPASIWSSATSPLTRMSWPWRSSCSRLACRL